MNIPKEEFILILNGDKETIEKYRNLIIPEKACACCGVKFIPNKRADEKYCPKCKEIGYEKTMNETQKDIVRERKRVNGLLQRGRITREQYEEHMKQYIEKSKTEVQA